MRPLRPNRILYSPISRVMFIVIPMMAGKSAMGAVGKTPLEQPVLPGHLPAQQQDRLIRLQPGRQLHLHMARVRQTSQQPDKARPTNLQVLATTGLQAWIVRTIPGNGPPAETTSTLSREVRSSGAGQAVGGAGS